MSSYPTPYSLESAFAVGTVSLAVASLLLPFGLSYPTLHNPRVDLRGAAWEYLSYHYELAYIVLALSLICFILGFFTISHFVLRHPIRSTTSFVVGTLLSVVGFASLLTAVGVRLAIIEYAQTYVLIDRATLSAFHFEAIGARYLPSASLGNMFVMLGAGWFHRGMRECLTFPRWTSTLYLLGVFVILISGGVVFTPSFLGYGPMSQMVRVGGGILIGGTGLVWAQRMWQLKATLHDMRLQRE